MSFCFDSSVHSRELRDLVFLIGNSGSSAEQQAALKVVARIAAMSPEDGAVLVQAGLISVSHTKLWLRRQCQLSASHVPFQ